MSTKKILLGAFGSLLLALIGLGLLVFVFLPRYVEAEAVRLARERGVELVPGKLELGFGWVRLKDAKLTLIGVEGLSLHVDSIDTELAGFTPKAFALRQVDARAERELPVLFRELMAWVRAHEGELREPVTVTPLEFQLFETGPRTNEPSAPSLVLEGGELRVMSERRLLTVKRVRAFQRELGEARLLSSKDRARLALTLGESAIENPSLAIDLDQSSPSEDRVNVALSPTRLGHLGALFGVPSPLDEAVTVTGTFTARIPEALAAGAAIEGVLDVALKGYVPPHPVELDGFVFGDTTLFATRYRLDPERYHVDLNETRLKAGAFALAGRGTLDANFPAFGLSLLLSGALPCNALASAAAQTRLGQALGKVTGKAAMQTLSGSVGVRVSVQASSANLMSPRVLRTITPGCGLKPLSYAELVKLGELVPEALDPKVAEDFQELMRKTFPTLPSVPGVNAPLPLPVPSISPPILPTPALPRLHVAPRASSSAAPERPSK